MGAAEGGGARYPVCGTRKIPVRGAGGAILALGESEVLRRVSGKTLFGVAAQGLLPHVHSRASAARGEAEIERSRMDEGIGARKTGARGGSAVRLCNLVAQGPFATQGTIQAGGGGGIDREGYGIMGDHLLQVVQNTDSRGRGGGCDGR